MAFRIYISLVLIFIIALFIELRSIGLFGLLISVFIFPLFTMINYYKWKAQNKEKLLSYRIKSIKRQKQNFKFIKTVLSHYPSVALLCKKASIMMDDVHIKPINPNKIEISRDNYLTDIKYQNMPGNIHHGQ